MEQFPGSPLDRINSVNDDKEKDAELAAQVGRMDRAINRATKTEVVMRFIEKYPDLARQGEGTESVFGNVAQQIKNAEGAEKNKNFNITEGIEFNIDRAYQQAKAMISPEEFSALEKGE
ncbi:MAG: hypothetical protein Q7T49_01195 [bacterium]|nr:hypothetical protein [bacterium]